MATLTISTVDLTSTAQSIPVGIETCDINGVPVSALTSSSVVVPSEYRETDASGNLSIDLIPNADLNPTNTFYKVTLAGGTWIILKSAATQTIIQALAATPSALSSGTALYGATGPTGPSGPTGPTGAGVPAGGDNGWFLTKTSNLDYDTGWLDSPLPLSYGGTEGNLSGSAPGAIPYFSTFGPMQASSAGTAGQVLQSGGTSSPTWTTLLPVANGGTNSSATPTHGGVDYGTGSAHAFTAAGTAGQILQSNGAAAPTWVGGAWTATTCTVTASTTNPSLGSGGFFTNSVRYVRVGKTVIVNGQLIAGTASVTAGSGTYYFSLPVTSAVSTYGFPIGTVYSTTMPGFIGQARLTDTGKFEVYSTSAAFTLWTAANGAYTTGMQIGFTLQYEGT